MTNWLDYATPEDLAELERLKSERESNKAERRKIYERCYKRMRANPS